MRWLRARLSQPCREVAPVKEQKFDDQTGQVYTETTIAATKPDYDWHHRSRSSGEWIESHWRDDSAKATPLVKVSKKDRSSVQGHEMRKSKVSSKRGARSLMDTAMESIMQKVRDLSIEVLRDISPILLRKIWDQIRTRNLLTFHVWQVFSTLLREQDASLSLYRYQDQIKDPMSSLEGYTTPLASESFKFLSFLSITTLFSVPDLVKLHTLRNLTALEIICVGKPNHLVVTNRLVRSWSIAAKNDGGFPVLRILKLWQHPLITNVSLEYLGSFPSLAIYDVTGCGFDRLGSMKIKPYGWTPIVDGNLLQRLESACVERAVIMRSNLGKSSHTFRKSFIRQLLEEAHVSFVPRAQVPDFLTRDKTVTRDESQKNSSTSEKPSHHRSQPAASSQTWESSIYLKICKIGELRNDGDLKRAGIEIGEQPIVNNELICPLPLVCLRLGPTPLSQLLCTDISYYSGSPLREDYDDERPLTPVNRGPNGALDSQRLAFMRIKYDSQETQPLQKTSNSSDSLKRPMSAVSRPTSSGESAPAKRKMGGLQRRKKALGDMLASFLP